MAHRKLYMLFSANSLVVSFVIAKLLFMMHLIVVPHSLLLATNKLVHTAPLASDHGYNALINGMYGVASMLADVPPPDSVLAHDHDLFELNPYGTTLPHSPTVLLPMPLLTKTFGTAVTYQFYGTIVPVILYAMKNSPPAVF